MKRILIGLSSLVLAVLLFAGGVFAANSEWKLFEGGAQITQSNEGLDRIMEILRSIDSDKKDLKRELAEIESILEGIEDAPGNSGFPQQIKKLRDDLAQANKHLKEAQDELITVNATIGLRDQTIEGLNSQVTELENYVTHLERELTTANEAVSNHAGNVTDALKEAEGYTETEGDN